ncbi:uncharacterized protein B0I36DRAFT_368253 [Microdochium trichocladiopsis]|uniref:Pre-mRNA-splicing factor 38B n=1 Tax=Microdochium trichocladiopsis TaxID=1682393 RepID=A0A9P9BMW4_9PEZI|nr:uncharacterized protein B0I36DRAFT_368253 [Microdochium trichocladiopsis]KAH7018212.1 hypothetical protein B0I36DRAFT_368253 [Microdochium trichocladiopsis]
MPEKEYPLLTDDYVAGLLSQEANDCSTKYSALGLDAYKSSKRPQNQPKPNTRFLNNIIRDTNSHNRALLAKESAESQARLRELEQAERDKQREQERLQRRARPGPADTRKRILGDIAAFISPGAASSSRATKRRRGEAEGAETAEDGRRGTDDRERSRPPRRSRGDTTSGRHSSSRSQDLFNESGTTRESAGRLNADKSRDDHDRKSRRRAYRDRSDDETSRSHKKSSRRDTSQDDAERGRHHHKSSRHKGERDRHHKIRSRSRSPARHKRSAPSRSSRTRDAPAEMESDSDPLDDLIGPTLPPKQDTVRARGRGAHASSSGIDGRFAADYDPTMDVGPEPASGSAEADWEGTVEAYRDRQKWRKQGAERLRSVGFTEDEIKRWETGDKKDETDVRWTKQGAVREWDRGKVVDTDGDVALEPEWGRLKGT